MPKNAVQGERRGKKVERYIAELLSKSPSRNWKVVSSANKTSRRSGTERDIQNGYELIDKGDLKPECVTRIDISNSSQ
jgi:hypothetical protein